MNDSETLLRELKDGMALARVMRAALFLAKRQGIFPRLVQRPDSSDWELVHLTLEQSLHTAFPDESDEPSAAFFRHRIAAMRRTKQERASERLTSKIMGELSRQALLEHHLELLRALADYQILCTHAEQFGWYPRWEKDPDLLGAERRIYDRRLSELLALRTHPATEALAALTTLSWLKKLPHTPCATIDQP